MNKLKLERILTNIKPINSDDYPSPKYDQQIMTTFIGTLMFGVAFAYPVSLLGLGFFMERLVSFFLPSLSEIDVLVPNVGRIPEPYTQFSLPFVVGEFVVLLIIIFCSSAVISRYYSISMRKSVLGASLASLLAVTLAAFLIGLPTILLT